jgi:PAS domain S-box-containing protein
MRQSITRRTVWGFGFTLLILCAISVFSFRAVKSLVNSAEERSKSFRLISILQRIESELKDAETGERGFLLTGDPKYLEPYEKSLRDHGSNFNELKVFMKRRERTSSSIARLESLVRRKQEEMEKTINLRRSAGFDAAVQVVLTGQGKQLMDEIRTTLSELVKAENAALAKRDSQVSSETRIANAAMLYGTIAAALVAAAAGILIWFAYREREQAEDSLRLAHEGLEQKVRERTSEIENANSRLRDEIRIREEAEVALERQRHFLNAVLDSLDEGIIACDANGEIILLNRATRLLEGLPEAIGCNGAEKHDEAIFFDPDGITRMPDDANPISRAWMGQVVQNSEMILASPSGARRTLLVSGQQIIDKQQKRLGAVVTTRDITELKRSEEVRRAQQTAEASNRAKSEFLSRMSHELRTPLNAILGFAQVLEMDSLNAEQMDSVEQILKGGRHLLSLINEVLDISRIEAGRLAISPEPVLLSDAVREVADLVAPLATQKRVSVHLLNSCLTETYALADRQRIKQVLLNLMSNAIKYNHEGGWIRVACDEKESKVRVTISDCGRGIPAGRIHRLFTPFDRLGAEQGEEEGTGLGLCLSRGLIELMDGTMGVESEQGTGSSFWFELARAENPEKHADMSVPAPSSKIYSPGQSHSVLYIEDNLSNLRLVERVLGQRPGVDLLPAMQGRLGIELATQHRPSVIFLDLNLPDMHGTEVLERLRSNPVTQKIPVIIVSADATHGQRERLLKSGAKSYLTKPINVMEFLRELDTALREQSAPENAHTPQPAGESQSGGEA